jgi:hypothetical protein
VQRGGFASEEDARAALARALERLRREGGIGTTLTLAEFVDEYLDQHDASPVTLKKLRFLLTRAVQAFGDYSSAAPACPTTPTPSVVTSNSDRELVACTPKVPSLTGTAAFDKPRPPKSGGTFVLSQPTTRSPR